MGKLTVKSCTKHTFYIMTLVRVYQKATDKLLFFTVWNSKISMIKWRSSSESLEYNMSKGTSRLDASLCKEPHSTIVVCMFGIPVQ